MNASDTGFAWRAFNLNWAPIALLGAALVSALLFTDFSLEPSAFGVMFGIGGLLATVVYGYALARGNEADPKLIFWLGATSQAVVATAIVGPLSYVANATSWPLQDDTLLCIDRALGLDPKAIAAFVNARSWLANLLGVGYGFVKLPMLGIPIIMAMTLRFARLQQFVLALNIALVATIVISIFVPAIGTFYGLHMSPTEYFPAIDATFYNAQLRDILALRDGSLRHLDLLKMTGVVSFPSFHAASAVLFTWALWQLRSLRWASLGTNLLMIAATPILGAHYVVDIIAGMAVAVVAIVLAKQLLRVSDAKDVLPVDSDFPVNAALQHTTRASSFF